MNTPSNQAMTQILQMMSSTGLSPDQFRTALANPERMMELIGGSSHAEHTPMQYSADEAVSQVNEARARWEAEARLPPQKLRLSQRYELEAENREVEKQMVQFARDGAVLQTFVGQDQSFSTTPIEQLEKSAWQELVIVFVLILRYKFLCKTCLHVEYIRCVFTVLSRQYVSLNNVALGAISCLPDHIQSRQLSFFLFC